MLCLCMLLEGRECGSGSARMEGGLSAYENAIFDLRVLPELRKDSFSVESHLAVARRRFLDISDQALENIVAGYVRLVCRLCVLTVLWVVGLQATGMRAKGQRQMSSGFRKGRLLRGLLVLVLVPPVMGWTWHI